MAGPMCGMLLADMGADVIKLEKYPGGDDTRRSTPPSIAGEPAAFMVMNCNKRGIVLDLKAEAGREALLRLVDNADIVIENYRKGALEKLGLGYETLQARNPRLIFCSISGFGRTGPYADRGGFDLIAQGISGVMSVTGEGPGRAPVKVGPPIADISAGLLATIGILAALYNRQQTGLGQMVNTSLLEAGISFLHWPAAIAFATGAAPGPLGSGHPLMAPYQAFVPPTCRSRWGRRTTIIGAGCCRFCKRPISPRMSVLPAMAGVWPICRNSRRGWRRFS